MISLTAALLVASMAALSSQPPPAKPKADETTRNYAIPPDKVFLAAAQVAAQKWNVTHSDKDTLTVSFKTGASMRTWKGFEVSVVCIEQPDGSTVVRLHPQKRPSGQLFSWKEGGRIASQFFEALDTRLREMKLLDPPR